MHDVHVAEGAVFTDFAGWTMPLKYGSEPGGHAAVRTAAGLVDLSHMGEIVVLGPEAGPDRYLVVANASNRETVAAALRERAVGFTAEVQDESDDIGLLALQGPRALEVLSEVGGFSADQDERTEERFVELLAALGNYRFLAAWYRGHPVLVARTGYTGEIGYELFLAPALLPQLWRAIRETGAGSGVLPVGLAARDTLRLEAGMPLYGNELTTATRPQQAGLGRLVRPEKAAPYVGREAVEASVAEGQRTLVGLVSDGRRAGRHGYAVTAGGRVVGEVTSGALSPSLGHPIAMAYLDPDAVLRDDLAIDVR